MRQCQRISACDAGRDPRLVPATPMSRAIGGAIAAASLGKQSRKPISPAEASPLIQRLSMVKRPLSSDLPNNLSCAPSGTYDYNSLPQALFDDAAAGAYGAGAFGQGMTGSTALYHHNDTRYELGLGRTNGDAKMNGIHGPKHKRGDKCE